MKKFQFNVTISLADDLEATNQNRKIISHNISRAIQNEINSGIGIVPEDAETFTTDATVEPVETLYILFGSSACSLYEQLDWSLSEASEETLQEIIDSGSIGKFDNPLEALNVAEGWGGFFKITEEEYKILSEFEDKISEKYN